MPNIAKYSNIIARSLTLGDIISSQTSKIEFYILGKKEPLPELGEQIMQYIYMKYNENLVPFHHSHFDDIIDHKFQKS